MKIRTILILLLVSFLAFSLLGRWTTSAVRNTQNQALIHLSDSLTQYEVVIDGLVQVVYEKDQIILSKDQAIALGLLEADRLKKLNLRNGAQITRIEAQLTAARDSIPLDFSPHPIVQIDTESDTINDTVTSGETKNPYVQLPLSFTYTEQYLKLNTGVDINGFGWFDITAPASLVITLGDKKTGLFRSTPTVSVTTPNHYLQITDIQMVNTDVKKWHDSWLLPAGVGLAIGGVTYFLVRGFFE